MSLIFTIYDFGKPIFSIKIEPRDVVKESFFSTHNFKVIKSGKIYDVTIETNCPTYVFLQKINSFRQYEIWTHQYLEECSKRYSSKYYDTSIILRDFFTSVRHGTYLNMFSIVDLYRNIKKTNIESSTIEFFQKLFSYVIEGSIIEIYGMSEYIFYSLFEEKMIKIITFLYSKKAFKKANGILLALLHLSKSKINTYTNTSIKCIIKNLMNMKRKNFYCFTLCSFKICNSFKICSGQIPYRLIYSYI